MIGRHFPWEEHSRRSAREVPNGNAIEVPEGDYRQHVGRFDISCNRRQQMKLPKNYKSHFDINTKKNVVIVLKRSLD